MDFESPSNDPQISDDAGSSPAAERRGISEFSSRFQSLYDGYFKKLVSYLYKEFGPGPPPPEDVAQQAFAKILQRGSLDDVDHPEAFARIAAVNIVRSEKRALRVRADYIDEKIQGHWGDECDEFDPERVLMASEELDLIAAVLQAMPARRREIFIACRLHGLTAEQAGRQQGVSRTSAVRHIAVATAAILAALDGNPVADEGQDGIDA